MAAPFDRALRDAIGGATATMPGVELQRAVEALSRRYRDGAAAAAVGRLTDAERLAYAVVRLPATAAALDAVFDAVERHTRVEPRTVTDLGAGPGTVLWPAVWRWPGIDRVTLLDLADSPRLTFDQGANNSFYFAEEILSTLSSAREIRVSDRATIFNLMIGLDGYTISTGIISDDLDPEIVAIPLDVDERIEIGWIGHTAIPLTEQAQRYLAELRAVVAEFGVALLG